MSTSHYFRFFLLALVLGAAPVLAQTRVLVLNSTNEPPYSTEARDGYADIIAIEAFRRQGIELRLVQLPAERGLVNANAGTEDGDMVRIAGLEKLYPNLVRVPEKFMDWEFSAFSKNPSQTIGWPEIRQRTVGHIKGWKIYEQHLIGAPSVIAADDAEQMFRLLALGRIEIALYERWQGMALAKKQGLNDIWNYRRPLATREMYIYLHKSHAALVPKLAATLRALKAEGFYEQAYREKLGPLRKDNAHD